VACPRHIDTDCIIGGRSIFVKEKVCCFVPLEIIGPKSLGIVLWRRIYLGIDIDDVDVAYSIYPRRDPINPAEIDAELASFSQCNTGSWPGRIVIYQRFLRPDTRRFVNLYGDITIDDCSNPRTDLYLSFCCVAPAITNNRGRRRIVAGVARQISDHTEEQDDS
jgi:hypothetical protein